jgi:hypothetical protein
VAAGTVVLATGRITAFGILMRESCLGTTDKLGPVGTDPGSFDSSTWFTVFVCTFVSFRIATGDSGHLSVPESLRFVELLLYDLDTIFLHGLQTVFADVILTIDFDNLIKLE